MKLRSNLGIIVFHLSLVFYCHWLFNLPQCWGCHYYYFFFSSCQNVNFNEKFLQIALPLSGMSLQAKSGLDESEALMDLFSPAYSHIGAHIFFSSIHIHIISLIPLGHLLSPPARYPHIYSSISPVLMFSFQISRIVCATKLCPLPYILTQVLLYTDTPQVSHIIPHHLPLFLTPHLKYF